jgi:hypothetical protein
VHIPEVLHIRHTVEEGVGHKLVAAVVAHMAVGWAEHTVPHTVGEGVGHRAVGSAEHIAVELVARTVVDTAAILEADSVGVVGHTLDSYISVSI